MARSGSLFSDMGMDRTFFKLFFPPEPKLMGPGSLSVFVWHQGDQTYVQSGMYASFRTTIVEALALSQAFSFPSDHHDSGRARAITMQKKKFWDGPI